MWSEILLRWYFLFASLLLSVWLTQHMSLWRWFLVSLLISILWVVYIILKNREFKRTILITSLTPILLWISVLGILVFAEEGWVRYSILLFALLFSWAWAKSLDKGLQEINLLNLRGNLTSYINSLILFFVVSSLFAGRIFLGWYIWFILTAILLISFSLHLHILLQSNVSFLRGWVYSLISALIITEVASSLFYWPTSFWVNGVFVTVSFYILSGISRCALTSVLTGALIRKYIYWGGGILALILLSAKWK